MVGSRGAAHSMSIQTRTSERIHFGVNVTTVSETTANTGRPEGCASACSPCGLCPDPVAGGGSPASFTLASQSTSHSSAWSGVLGTLGPQPRDGVALRTWEQALQLISKCRHALEMRVVSGLPTRAAWPLRTLESVSSATTCWLLFDQLGTQGDPVSSCEKRVGVRRQAGSRGMNPPQRPESKNSKKPGAHTGSWGTSTAAITPVSLPPGRGKRAASLGVPECPHRALGGPCHRPCGTCSVTMLEPLLPTRPARPHPGCHALIW